MEQREVPIKVSGKAVSYFGSQSISNKATAMFELIKNSRDADAKSVLITFELDGPHERIVIEDDGIGMTTVDIINKWLVAGTDTKVTDTTSPSGRRVVGEKGIGRFACEKLAKKLTLESYPKDKNEAIWMSFDWSKYERPGITFDQVRHPLRVSKKDDQEKHGLCLTLEYLNGTWSEIDVQTLKTDLGKFILPKEINDPGRMDIMIKVPKYNRLDGKIEGTITKDAPITMCSRFDGEVLSVVINDVDDKAKERSDRKPDPINLSDKRCGPFQFMLYFYPRETAKKKGGHYEKHYDKDIDDFLRKYSGVHLYKDGVSMKSTGTKNDWLGLEARRVQRRSRIGGSQVYGIVQITQDENSNIRSTSHRETIHENAEFTDLQEVILNAISLLEKYWDRSKKERRVVRPIPLAENNIDAVIKTAKQLKMESNSPAVEKIIECAIATRKYMHEENKNKNSEIEEFGELRHHEDVVAAIGLLTSYMASSIASPLASNIKVIANIRRTMEDTDFSKVIDKNVVADGWSWIESLENNTNRMLHFTEFVQELSQHIAISIQRIGKPVQFKVVDAWKTVAGGFEDFIKDHNIDVSDSISDGRNIKFSRIDIEAILTNLFLNSIDALKNVDGPRRIIFKVGYYDNNMEIKFTDNGKGIKRGDLERVFEPFYVGGTESESGAHGRGLGLSIVKKIVDRHNGKVEAVSPSLEFSGTGTTISISFPNVYKVVRRI